MNTATTNITAISSINITIMAIILTVRILITSMSRLFPTSCNSREALQACVLHGFDQV